MGAAATNYGNVYKEVDSRIGYVCGERLLLFSMESFVLQSPMQSRKRRLKHDYHLLERFEMLFLSISGNCVGQTSVEDNTLT
jgi:hypothetical protein